MKIVSRGIVVVRKTKGDEKNGNVRDRKKLEVRVPNSCVHSGIHPIQINVAVLLRVPIHQLGGPQERGRRC
jgi:hypothetical protein